MPTDAGSAARVEIAHVLTMDLVGYSNLLITEQTRILAELTQIVKGTMRFQRAEAEGKLVRLPTGDGMLLVFFDDPQAPIECATEIASALQNHPDIQLRMGIHSGPVNEVVDVNDFQRRSAELQYIMIRPQFEHLRREPRVADLIRRMGLNP